MEQGLTVILRWISLV